MNVLGVFVFRIPALWFPQNYTDIGSVSVGIVMLVSSVSGGVCAAAAGFLVIRRVIRKTAVGQ